MVEKDRMTAETRTQKVQERLEAIENAVILYAPGEEPANIRKCMDTLFGKLDAPYSLLVNLVDHHLCLYTVYPMFHT